MKRICATLMLLAAAPSAWASERVFTDGDYFVYREAQSCALYADYPNDIMLRVSYRPRAEQVFLSVVAPGWKDRLKIGGTYTSVIYYREDLNTGYGVPMVGFHPPNDEDRVGVSGLAPPGFLRRLQKTGGLRFTVDGQELTRMSTPRIARAVDSLVACSRKHFS